MRPARVEVFGIVRPGDVYEMPAERLAAFVAELNRRDADFYEVLDIGEATRCEVCGAIDCGLPHPRFRA